MTRNLPLDPTLHRLKELHADQIELSRNRHFDLFGQGIGLKALRLHERFVRLAALRAHSPTFREDEDGSVEMTVYLPEVESTERYYMSAARYAYFRERYWEAAPSEKKPNEKWQRT